MTAALTQCHLERQELQKKKRLQPSPNCSCASHDKEEGPFAPIPPSLYPTSTRCCLLPSSLQANPLSEVPSVPSLSTCQRFKTVKVAF